MGKLETTISFLENKFAVTWEEYSKAHPKTKKTPQDPLFTKEQGGKKPVQAPSKPESKTEPKPKPSPTLPKSEDKPPPVSSKPDPLDSDNPRKAADEKPPINKDPDYVFARASEISNVGEDLVNSARHKRNRWSSLQTAEEDGTAHELVTRNELLKNEPPNLIAKVNSHTCLTALAMHLAIQKFPAEPVLIGYENRPDDAIYMTRENVEIKMGEKRKEVRKQYYDLYKEIVAKAENLAETEPDPKKAISAIQDIIRNKIDDCRQKEYRSPFANLLVRYHNTAVGQNYRKATSVMSQMMVFTKNLKEKYNITDIDKSHLDRAAEHAKDIMEGDSFNKTFGKESDRKKGFDPRELYPIEATRVGPELKFKGAKKQTEFLTKKAGMRALQWGNSVTDDEREYHLEQSSMAFKDLTDVLGLPEELGSFHGKLGLAIGARGKGMALAHYEPTLRVINLTRKGGVGTLAHEWGHFFDNIMSEVMYGSKSGYASELAPNQSRGGESTFENGVLKKVEPKEHAEVTKSFLALGAQLQNFRYRLRSEDQFRQLSPGRKQYWSSTLELFARCFEKHVDHKLSKQGRKNTYLAGVTEHPFWPNKEEVEKMAPLFDDIFEKFKASKYIKKAMMLLAAMAEKMGADKPYRGKFRFTHDASFLSLKGMNLEKPDDLRKEFESILKATKPEVTLGKPKVAHFNMYGRSIGAYTFPISPPEAFMHSGGGEDPSVIAFRKVCDDLTLAGFVKGKSKKKKKKGSMRRVILALERRLKVGGAWGEYPHENDHFLNRVKDWDLPLDKMPLLFSRLASSRDNDDKYAALGVWEYVLTADRPGVMTENGDFKKTQAELKDKTSQVRKLAGDLLKDNDWLDAWSDRSKMEKILAIYQEGKPTGKVHR